MCIVDIIKSIIEVWFGLVWFLTDVPLQNLALVAANFARPPARLVADCERAQADRRQRELRALARQFRGRGDHFEHALIN